MQHNRDILWKGLLEWVFDDLLRFVFPEADKEFDMQRGFTYLDKELAELYPEPEREIDIRRVDKLVKAFRKVAKELGCDKSEQRFQEALFTIGRQKILDGEKPVSKRRPRMTQRSTTSPQKGTSD